MDTAAGAPAAVAPFARLCGLDKHFADGTVALRGLDLTIEPGTFVALVGPSGCGKSTVLRILAGLAAPSAGSVEFSRDGAGRPEDRRHSIGYVFQDPTLMPWLNVRQNVALPLRLGGEARRETARRAQAALASVGLADFAAAHPRQLSGGMRMRVSMARAIVTRPTVLLLDEPFAALDELTRWNLNVDLLQLWARERFTAVFVTHSVSEAVFLSQRVCVMTSRPGRIIGDYSIDIPVGLRTPEIRTSASYNERVRDIAHCLRGGMHA